MSPRRRLFLDPDIIIAIVCCLVLFVAGSAAGFVVGMNW